MNWGYELSFWHEEGQHFQWRAAGEMFSCCSMEESKNHSRWTWKSQKSFPTSTHHIPVVLGHLQGCTSSTCAPPLLLRRYFFLAYPTVDPRSTTKPKALRNLGACMQWMFSSQRASSSTQNMEGGWLCSPRSCYTVFFADRRKRAGDDWELCAAEKEENRRWRRVAWCRVTPPVVLTGLMCA